MKIRFIKDAYNQAKNITYWANHYYDLPALEAQYYITQKYAINGNEALNDFMDKLVGKKPSSAIFKELRINPTQGKTISLPLLNKGEQELITSKKYGRGIVDYLKTNKDISVADIGEILLSVLEYAIDNKDSQTIDRVTKDLSVIYKLVKIKRAGNDK